MLTNTTTHAGAASPRDILSHAADLHEACVRAEKTDAFDGRYEKLKNQFEQDDQHIRGALHSLMSKMDDLLERLDAGTPFGSRNTTPEERRLQAVSQQLKRAQKAAQQLDQKIASAQQTVTQRRADRSELMRQLRECPPPPEPGAAAHDESQVVTDLAAFLKHTQTFLRNRRVEAHVTRAVDGALSGRILPEHFTRALADSELVAAVDKKLRPLLIRESLGIEEDSIYQQTVAEIAALLGEKNTPDTNAVILHFIRFGVLVLSLMLALLLAVRWHVLRNQAWLQNLHADTTDWLDQAVLVGEITRIWNEYFLAQCQPDTWPPYFTDAGKLLKRLTQSAAPTRQYREAMCNAMEMRATTAGGYHPNSFSPPRDLQEIELGKLEDTFSLIQQESQKLAERLAASAKQFPDSDVAGFFNCLTHAPQAYDTTPGALRFGRQLPLLTMTVWTLYAGYQVVRQLAQNRQVDAACEPLARNIVQAYRDLNVAPAVRATGQRLRDRATHPVVAECLEKAVSHAARPEAICAGVKDSLDALKKYISARRRADDADSPLAKKIDDANDALRRAENEILKLDDTHTKNQAKVARLLGLIAELQTGNQAGHESQAASEEIRNRLVTLGGQLSNIERLQEQQRAAWLNSQKEIETELKEALREAKATRHNWQRFDQGEAATRARSALVGAMSGSAWDRTRKRHVGLSADDLASRIRTGRFESAEGARVETSRVPQASSYFTDSHFHLAMADALARAKAGRLPEDQPVRIGHGRRIGLHVSLTPQGELQTRDVSASEATFRYRPHHGVRIEHIHPVP